MPEITYGAHAATSRACLSEEEQVLFDWMTVRLYSKDATFYGSLLQGVACRFRRATYWQLVAMVKKIAEEPGFAEIKAEADKMAVKSITEIQKKGRA